MNSKAEHIIEFPNQDNISKLGCKERNQSLKILVYDLISTTKTNFEFSQSKFESLKNELNNLRNYFKLKNNNILKYY